MWKFLARHVIWTIFIGCAWCNLLYRQIFINMAARIQLTRIAQPNSRPTSIWEEMKSLKIKLPNHFSVYVTNGKWPKNFVISETAIFIKFHWIHWHENEFIKKKQKDVITTRIASHLASIIYRNNQNNFVWGKDRQEDLMEIFNESID